MKKTHIIINNQKFDDGPLNVEKIIFKKKHTEFDLIIINNHLYFVNEGWGNLCREKKEKSKNLLLIKKISLLKKIDTISLKYDNNLVVTFTDNKEEFVFIYNKKKYNGKTYKLY